MNVTVRLVCRCISVYRRIWNNNVDAFFCVYWNDCRRITIREIENMEQRYEAIVCCLLYVQSAMFCCYCFLYKIMTKTV